VLARNAKMTDLYKNYTNIIGQGVGTNVVVFDIPMSDIEAGRQFFMAVKVVDGEGFESALTPAVALESPLASTDVVVASSSLASVVVFVCLVIVVLAVGFGYYFVKHRRLRRGMQDFVSRYSPASGAANIFNSQRSGSSLLVATGDPDSGFSLGGPGADDDTAPIIRGFSDDEPLVMNT